MLKFLFTAHYSDGTSYKQNEEDRSTQDSTRSAFYDIDQEKLIAFELTSPESNIFVDLRDGSFSVNGLPFLIYDEPLKIAD